MEPQQIPDSPEIRKLGHEALDQVSEHGGASFIAVKVSGADGPLGHRLKIRCQINKVSKRHIVIAFLQVLGLYSPTGIAMILREMDDSKVAIMDEGKRIVDAGELPGPKV